MLIFHRWCHKSIHIMNTIQCFGPLLINLYVNLSYLHVGGLQFGWILWVDSRHATKPSHLYLCFWQAEVEKTEDEVAKNQVGPELFSRTFSKIQIKVIARFFAYDFLIFSELEFISSGSLGHCHRLTSAAEQGEFDVPSVKQRKTLKQLPLQQQESIFRFYQIFQRLLLVVVQKSGYIAL